MSKGLRNEKRYNLHGFTFWDVTGINMPSVLRISKMIKNWAVRKTAQQKHGEHFMLDDIIELSENNYNRQDLVFCPMCECEHENNTRCQYHGGE